MRQAIVTRYVGPTNHRGSRVIATTGSGLRLVVAWDYALGQGANHRAAALALAAKLGWEGDWVGGSTPTGFAFVDATSGRLAD